MPVRRNFTLLLCALLFSLFFSSPLDAHGELGPLARSVQVTPDPIGDTFGTGAVRHDIASLEKSVGPDQVTFEVRFTDEVVLPSAFSPNSVAGYIDLDVDGNAATGAASKVAEFGPPGPDVLGAEYFVDLFSEQFSPSAAEVVDAATMLPVGLADVEVTGEILAVHVPLTLIGGSGDLNYGVIMGTFNEFNDVAVALAIPEPSTLAIGLLVLPFALVRRKWRGSRSGPSSCP